MAWKARDSLVLVLLLAILIDYFLPPLAFSFPEGAVKNICVRGGNEVTDQKRL